MTDTTIACTLAPAAYRDRTAALADLADRALITREPIASGERLTFSGTPAIERDLRAAVAAEASCCAFLTMDLAPDAEGRLVLDVTGPADAQPIIAELFAWAFPRSSSEPAR